MIQENNNILVDDLFQLNGINEYTNGYENLPFVPALLKNHICKELENASEKQKTEMLNGLDLIAEVLITQFSSIVDIAYSFSIRDIYTMAKLSYKGIANFINDIKPIYISLITKDKLERTGFDEDDYYISHKIFSDYGYVSEFVFNTFDFEGAPISHKSYTGFFSTDVNEDVLQSLFNDDDSSFYFGNINVDTLDNYYIFNQSYKQALHSFNSLFI